MVSKIIRNFALVKLAFGVRWVLNINGWRCKASCKVFLLWDVIKTLPACVVKSRKFEVICSGEAIVTSVQRVSLKIPAADILYIWECML